MSHCTLQAGDQYSFQHLQTSLQPFSHLKRALKSTSSNGLKLQQTLSLYIPSFNLFPDDAYWAKIWNILKRVCCRLRPLEEVDFRAR